MDENMEGRKLEVMVGDRCNVGYVVKIITRMIIHCTRVVGLIYMVFRRGGKLGMLVMAHNIPQIYATIDNKQASIIDMEGKLCGQVVSILIDLRSIIFMLVLT